MPSFNASQAQPDATGFFLDQHAFVHQIVDQLVLAGVDDEVLLRAPGRGLNSLAFLLWHATRWEDVLVNTWIGGQPQVIEDPAWRSVLTAAGRHVGTGLSEDEVAEHVQGVDPASLRGYWGAVGDRTRAVIARMPSEDLTGTVDNTRLSGASADGAWDNPRAAWLNQFFEGHSVAWHLAFLNVHLSEHVIGEALAVRSQLGVSLGL
jgi:DinB superfamily